jgi:hypothetical protein
MKILNSSTLAALEPELYDLASSEKALLNYLETTDSSTFSAEVLQQDISAVIQDKIDIYGTLASSISSQMGELATSQPVLYDQIQSLEVINTELAATQTQLMDVKKANDNHLRLIEINEYYADLYDHQTWLAKIVVIICIHVSVLCMLYKYNLLPKPLFYICLGGTFVVGSFCIIKNIVDISMRSNMNFQKYNFEFNPSSQNVVPANATPTNPWYAENNASTCAPCSSSVPAATS